MFKQIHVYLRKLYRQIMPVGIRQNIWLVKTKIFALIYKTLILGMFRIIKTAYEIIIFVFTRNTVRISFTNFWPNLDMRDNWFIAPLKAYLKTNGKLWNFVKYFKIDIHFFSVFGSIDKLINSRAKYKIFFTGENVNKNSAFDDFNKYEGNCVEYVNLSMGYDYMDKENYIRLPLWLFYFFMPLDTKDTIQRKLTEFRTVYEKTKFCALLAHHDEKYNLRTSIFNLVSGIGRVDCPGRLLHNDDTLHNQFNNNKSLYLRQYYFNICPENSNFPGYVTEKLFDAIYSGCIPIYNGGGGGDPEPGIINPASFLRFEPDADNSGLFAEIQKLYTDKEYYASFKARPVFLDTAVDKIHYMLRQYADRVCEIADKLLYH
jgi:hypothetical protein